MTAAITAAVLAYGTPLRVHAADEGLLRALLERLPPSWTFAADRGSGRCYALTRSAGNGSLLLSVDGAPLAEGGAEHALAAFQDDVDSHVAECSPDRVFVHAGVVEWRGSLVLLPGPSLVGKTTLTAALLRAGATYFSDEFAVLDGDGRAHAFPRPLRLRDGGSGTRTSRSADSLRSRVGSGALPVGLVVVARYDQGARSWRPRPLSPGHGALELLANTVSARRDPRRALRVLERVAARAVFLKGDRGEARDVAPAILELAGRAGAT